jgi:hypothetical protein
MKLKDLIGKLERYPNSFIATEGSNQTNYHDYYEVVIHLTKVIDGETFEKIIWESNGAKAGQQTSFPLVCIGTDIFNHTSGCEKSNPISNNIKEYSVISIDFLCELSNKIEATSYGNKYRQKTCTYIIKVK